MGRIRKKDEFQLQEKGIIYWGNIKGAVTIALVLSLPTTLSYSYTIQAITYGVVLFSLFIQAPTFTLSCPAQLDQWE